MYEIRDVIFSLIFYPVRDWRKRILRPRIWSKWIPRHNNVKARNLIFFPFLRQSSCVMEIFARTRRDAVQRGLEKENIAPLAYIASDNSADIVFIRFRWRSLNWAVRLCKFTPGNLGRAGHQRENVSSKSLKRYRTRITRRRLIFSHSLPFSLLLFFPPFSLFPRLRKRNTPTPCSRKPRDLTAKAMIETRGLLLSREI